MPDSQTRLQLLYELFIRDEASPDEIREFWQLMERLSPGNPVYDSVFKLYDEEKIPESVLNKDWGDSAQRIFQQSKNHQGVLRHAWWWAAASLALLLGVSAFIALSSRDRVSNIGELTHNSNNVQDVSAPSISRATITLANGQMIFLDSTGNGVFALQSQVELKKTGDGKVVYHSTYSDLDQKMIYNTLTNPRGSRVVDMMLSDGTHVWLNAGSSITYPVAFIEKERRVSMVGEAYFEVAHNANEKFFVTANGLTTEVLGTHFNVNAYDDEQEVKVTLLKGRVKVITTDGHSSVISPGEQVVKKLNDELNTKQKVNTEEVMAWKNNMFIFEETNIREVMKAVERWYGVYVVYKGNFQDLDFGGSMSRQNNVSELLKRLEATRAMSFIIDGKKITVIRSK